MKEIKFVYFDVGGVLEFDYSGTNQWIEMRRDLGITEDLDDSFGEVWEKYEPRVCIDCDVDEIIPEFEQKTGVTFPVGYSMLEDFINRFEVNPSIWPVAKKAREKYSVGLLTNMYPRMFPLIQKHKLIPDVEWDVIVDSSVVGYQKPEDGIYQIAEEKAVVDPSQIFFIDNSDKNIEGAQKRGWQTLLYDPQSPEESSREIAKRLKI